ncbi:fumarylacetoacetate (FAA) hydrolase [Pirellula staleyi DSM 6068]|uniref:Fumarylacetoacetate (FAA) hydrolase n=1 Tax=Pirellula staleyi (strain ATCC 27377 / DSM 6068 / ICPB 4128) TaxID=530564 RepID=D2R2I0_PIRSD|nr:fumarylacetoacetate hydrolase family protein [Pirellula staleyi]ADB15089.1 fumarylacetoacetate (FAA) hydrolase [Pirellula staleyi DSM 6068]
MKLAKFLSPAGQVNVGRLVGDDLLPLDLSGGQYRSLYEVLESENPYETAEFLTRVGEKFPLDSVQLLAPIDHQEVWAAGVTYKRSRTARMEESATAASCYDRVYASPRPELFYKASPHRVSGHGQPLRIRKDSEWNVPEPELALVLTSKMQLVGFTIGNDMSSRDIEGDNPLYLPQAKCYNQCCGLGPWITLAVGMPSPNDIGIRLLIHREGKAVYDGRTSVDHMARSFENLISWLSRDNSFPRGAFLLTGTGIVPDNSFTLHPGDLVEIKIDGIGTLINPVVQG